jgi:predicted short-subunit dehydrogenase-like oxidoreductase (DUF2520 family)
MRQVPVYAVIGDGKVARQFTQFLEFKKISFAKWQRNSTWKHLVGTVGPASHVLLLISDSAIDDFVDSHQNILKDKILVHCSGSLLSKKAFSAHPLQSFCFGNFNAERFEKIPFIIEESGPSFSDLLPAFSNPHFAIKRENKPYYHSLCVMANNFTTVLWQKLFHEFEGRLQIPPSVAFPILEQTLANLKSDFRNALTGPLAREDFSTLEKNMRSLEGDPFQAVFREFVNMHRREGK